MTRVESSKMCENKETYPRKNVIFISFIIEKVYIAENIAYEEKGV